MMTQTAGEKEIIPQIFGTQLIVQPLALLEDTLEALKVWGLGECTEEMPGPQEVCLLL